MRAQLLRLDCSTGIHMLLEECGLVFVACLVKLLAGDQDKEDHLAISPKGSVPALVLDYVEFLAKRIDISLPDNCATHYRRLLSRPAVRQVLAEEGYASALR